MTYQDPNQPYGQQPGYGQPPYGQQPGYGQTPPGYQPYPGGGDSFGAPTLAGWGYRVGASLIDLVILIVVNVIVDLALGQIAGIFIGFVVTVLYGGLLIGSQGRTVGMMALGTQCLDLQTGGPIGYGRAFGRSALYAIAPYLLFIPWLLDILWPLWDDKNQTIHDKVVNSLVVITRR